MDTMTTTEEYDKTYQCVDCGKSFGFADEYENHNHNDILPWKCTLCEGHFANRTTYMVHFKKAHHAVKDRRPFPCTVCDKEFTNHQSLVKHLRVLHDVIIKAPTIKFECQMCQKTFQYRSSLKGHMRHMHSELRPFECPDCHKKFKTNGDLKKHAIFHTGTYMVTHIKL